MRELQLVSNWNNDNFADVTNAMGNLGEASMIDDAGDVLVANVMDSIAKTDIHDGNTGDDPRLINWKITNRGKQTILVL